MFIFPSTTSYNNKENLVSRHKMQIQTQQRKLLNNRETRNETNVS